MKTNKVLTSKSYHEFLIQSLQDPEQASAYLAAILEETNPEPELFPNALMHVAEALDVTSVTSKRVDSQSFNPII